jgi:hypothetical protein
MSNTRVIEDFWIWFSSVNDQFGARFENAKLVAELDKQISLLGDISWELGPGLLEQSSSSLIFSPSGSKRALQLTKLIVSKAPEVQGWEFYPAIQPKNWNGIFIVTDTSGIRHKIDISQFRYTLLQYPDGLFGIALESPTLSNVPLDLHPDIGEIIVQSEIGEGNRIDHIATIDCSTKLESALNSASRPLAQLRENLNILLSRKS